MNNLLDMIRNRPSAILYLSILGVLAVTGARYSASNYLAQRAIKSDSFDDGSLAVRFQPENPGAHEALGIALERTNNFESAGDAFADAVSLSPNRYGIWLRLARARSLCGDVGSAERAYLWAIELAPSYSLPRMELGRMYLELGRRDEAFSSLATAARLDQSYYAEVLKSANATFGDDPEAIERALAPLSRKGRSIVAWYFLDRAWMTENTHAFLLSDEPSSDEKNTVIRFLKEKKQYTLAREVWLSGLSADVDSSRRLDIIFDGGFEFMTVSDPSGLGWQIDQDLSATSITLDRENVHSGRTAINVRFSGNVELQRPTISQLASVDAGKSYTLEFFVRASDIISAGMPAVLVTNPATNVVLGRSDPIGDTKGAWVRQSVTFVAPDESAVLVSLQRPDCKSQPCPIFGDASLDDFSITPSLP